MEKIKINNHVITQHRKNIAKYVSALKDTAAHQLKESKSLQEIGEVLREQLDTNTRNTRIYISYMPVSEWNKREYLGIRDSSQDCTLVSIRQEIDEKEEEEL